MIAQTVWRVGSIWWLAGRVRTPASIGPETPRSRLLGMPNGLEAEPLARLELYEIKTTAETADLGQGCADQNKFRAYCAREGAPPVLEQAVNHRDALVGLKPLWREVALLEINVSQICQYPHRCRRLARRVGLKEGQCHEALLKR